MIKYLHEVVENTPEGCSCQVDEQVNLANTSVVAYVLVSECSICQAIREAAASADAAAKKIARISEIKNQIVQLSIEKDKADTLGFSDLVTEKTNQISALQTELSALEA